MKENLDDFDYLLVYNKDETFESALNQALSGYDGDIEVYFAYS